MLGSSKVFNPDRETREALRFAGERLRGKDVEDGLIKGVAVVFFILVVFFVFSG